MREMLEAGLVENSCAPEIFVDCRRHVDVSSSPEKVILSWAQTFSCNWIVKQFFDKNSVIYRHDSENTIFIRGRRCN